MFLRHTIKYMAAILMMAGSLQALTESDTIENAVALAGKENRTVIVEFTGTDWCTACIHLHNKIMASAEFEKAVGDKYVAVQVDYPRLPKLVAQIPAEERARREDLLSSYGIRGLPSLVLMDSQGQPFAIITGTRPTPADFIKTLDEANANVVKRDAAFAKAANLEGLEKAKALAEGLEALPPTCRDKYTSVLNEIVDNDPENTLGYRQMLGLSDRLVEQTNAFRTLTHSFQGKFDTASLRQSLVQLDEFLARPDLEPEIRQDALRCKADCYAQLHDLENMLENMKAALEAAPNSRSAEKFRVDIEYIQGKIERMKQEKKAQ